MSGGTPANSRTQKNLRCYWKLQTSVGKAALKADIHELLDMSSPRQELIEIKEPQHGYVNSVQQRRGDEILVNGEKNPFGNLSLNDKSDETNYFRQTRVFAREKRDITSRIVKLFRRRRRNSQRRKEDNSGREQTKRSSPSEQPEVCHESVQSC